jgi:serine/threonine-protein kinase
MNPLLSANSIDEPPESFLRSVAEVFAVFDEKTQDSGNISYGVRTGEDRYFAKTAGIPDDDRPYLR